MKDFPLAFEVLPKHWRGRMDWVGTVGTWLLWATLLAVLLIGLNYALNGLAWCSLRSIWRLNAARYVARRLAPSDRIVCDDRGLYFSPRAQSSPPKLYFARNVAGWEPGGLPPEVCANSARDESSGRSIVLCMVVAALGFAWITVLLLHPGAADSFVSLVWGSPASSAGGPIFAALLLFSTFFVIHTIFPLNLGRFRGRANGAARDKRDSQLLDIPQRGDAPSSVGEWRATPQAPDGFIGSQETLDDLDRFGPLQRRASGARHESVFVGRYYRSLTLLHLKRHQDAVIDIATYVNAQRKALGERNYWTLKVRYLKAVNLAFLGKWSAALDEAQAVAPIQMAVLGANHPDTLMTRSARVTAWAMLERYAEAFRELDTLLPECERVFGPDDQFTSSNLRIRGIALHKLQSVPQEPDKVAATPVPTLRPAPKDRSPPQSAMPKRSAPRKPEARPIAPVQRQATGRRWTPLAAAAFLGALAIGAGLFAATKLTPQGGSNPPKAVAETSSPAPIPTPITPSEQRASEPSSMPVEGEKEDAPLEMAQGPNGLRVEQYAALMIAGRQGAKVRAGPSREAPLVVHAEAGTKLRVTGRTLISSRQWYRVVLADRRLGFVREDVLVRDPNAVEDYTPSSPMAAGRAGANVRTAPRIDAPLIVRLEAGSDLRVTGRKRASGATWYRVVVPDGRVGFVRDDVLESRPL